MKPGDLVVHSYHDEMIGILLEVSDDQRLKKHRFSIPWVYRVLWADASVKEHEMGTLRRIMIHEAG
jgi:hypothetical protein